ncbi:MAG: TetR/AcrR family transcriptional regulator, partial [Protaetiibacter sp.]
VTADAIDSRASGLLAHLITPEQFPEVHAALEAGVFSPDSDADSLGFGLERVLDGIEAYLATRPERHEAQAPVDPVDAAAERDPKYREAVKERREVEKRLREARKRERERLREARDRLRR